MRCNYNLTRMLFQSFSLYLILIVGGVYCKPAIKEVEDTAMLQMLDSMQQLMTGGGEYDREFYQELRACMDTFDPNLTKSQDSAWQGIIDYWVMDGVEGDTWGSTQTSYMEQNETATNMLGMIIYEPCNYASNVAYYHDVTEFCNRISMGSPFLLPKTYVDGLGKAYSSLAMGSAFMHGTHTHLGGQQDVIYNSIIAYVLHQGMLSTIPDCPPILSDFSATPRAKTAVELADDLMNMYIDFPVTEWREHTAALDIPDLYLTFACVFSTALTMAFEPDVVEQYVPILTEFFNLSDDITIFLTDEYLPALRNATGDIHLGIIAETRFLENAFSVAIKLIYALLWQEEVLTTNPIFLNETVNEWGWEMLPVLNTLVNSYNTYEYFEDGFQNGTNVYPGDEWCNPVGPHAKWHLETGIGLLDITYLGDEMYRILSENII